MRRARKTAGESRGEDNEGVLAEEESSLRTTWVRCSCSVKARASNVSATSTWAFERRVEESTRASQMSNNGVRQLHSQARLNTNCDGFLDVLELLVLTALFHHSPHALGNYSSIPMRPFSNTHHGFFTTKTVFTFQHDCFRRVQYVLLSNPIRAELLQPHDM
jgi:hypothetical protein